MASWRQTQTTTGTGQEPENRPDADIRQSDRYRRYLESVGWETVNLDGTGVFLRRLPLLSFLSVIKAQRIRGLNLAKLAWLAEKNHALLIKLEPETLEDLPVNTLKKAGFVPDNFPLLPTKTLVLNLASESLENLPKDTRYELRRAQKENLSVSQSSDTDLFYKLLSETMKLGGWSVPISREVTALFRAFQPDHSAILLTFKGARPVAGCLLIWEGDTAHYMYAAATREGRGCSAPYFTLWEAIRFCREKKLKFLDLEGIFDERYKKATKNWQGFTRFKQGWNGQVREYPGSFSRSPVPLLGQMAGF